MPQHHGIGLLCTTRSLGGIELNVLRLAGWMRERGHQTLVIGVEDSPLLVRAESDGLSWLSLGSPRVYGALGTARTLAAKLAEAGIHTLVLNTTKDLNLGVLTKRTAQRTLQLVHTQHMQLGSSKKDLLHRLQHARLDAWIAPLPWLARQTREWTTIPETRIHEIPFGIELSLFEKLPDKKTAQQNLALPPDAFIAGVIGRLDRGKGQEYLIHAAGLLKRRGQELHVLLLGDETLGEKQEYARELQELTTKLGLEERIHFRGFYENVAHGYAAMDCFVLSSLSETYGMVTIEAMAAGVPVIGTDSAGTPDILTSGRTGLLVPPRDPQALANALTKLMSNPELRAQLAAAAQKDAFERFSHHLQCSRIEELIERIHGN